MGRFGLLGYDCRIMQTKGTRILQWAILVSSLSAILIWWIQRLLESPLSLWLSQTITFFSFFTIWSNTLIVIMMVALMTQRGALYRFFERPSVQAACCLYIIFVGLAYWGLLGDAPRESIGDWIAELTGHTLSPILGLVYWWVAVPRGQLRWWNPLTWLIFPLTYLGYWLLRGPIVGYYPYFFLDVNTIGYDGVGVWTLVLNAAYLVLGWLMLLVDKGRALVAARGQTT